MRIVPDQRQDSQRLTVRLGAAARIEMVRIPAGTFLMGSPESEGGQTNERPRHQVTISRPFYMAVTLTTNRQLVSILGPTERRTRDGEEELSAHETTWYEAVKRRAKPSSFARPIATDTPRLWAMVFA